MSAEQQSNLSVKLDTFVPTEVERGQDDTIERFARGMNNPIGLLVMGILAAFPDMSFSKTELFRVVLGMQSRPLTDVIGDLRKQQEMNIEVNNSGKTRRFVSRTLTTRPQESIAWEMHHSAIFHSMPMLKSLDLIRTEELSGEITRVSINPVYRDQVLQWVNNFWQYSLNPREASLESIWGESFATVKYPNAPVRIWRILRFLEKKFSGSHLSIMPNDIAISIGYLVNKMGEDFNKLANLGFLSRISLKGKARVARYTLPLNGVELNLSDLQQGTIKTVNDFPVNRAFEQRNPLVRRIKSALIVLLTQEPNRIFTSMEVVDKMLETREQESLSGKARNNLCKMVAKALSQWRDEGYLEQPVQDVVVPGHSGSIELTVDQGRRVSEFVSFVMQSVVPFKDFQIQNSVMNDPVQVSTFLNLAKERSVMYNLRERKSARYKWNEIIRSIENRQSDLALFYYEFSYATGMVLVPSNLRSASLFVGTQNEAEVFLGQIKSIGSSMQLLVRQRLGEGLVANIATIVTDDNIAHVVVMLDTARCRLSLLSGGMFRDRQSNEVLPYSDIIETAVTSALQSTGEKSTAKSTFIAAKRK